MQPKCAFLWRGDNQTLLIELSNGLGNVAVGQIVDHLLLLDAKDPREDLDQLLGLHVVHPLDHPWQEQSHPEQQVTLKLGFA